ncbi:MAG: ABC transporter substrate-binding protein [Alicyclobacillus sp.]|nr:ABC transporter substrate-binding protein [Alicyclobacillus sp.]
MRHSKGWKTAGVALVASSLILAGCGSAGTSGNSSSSAGGGNNAVTANSGGAAGTFKVGVILSFSGTFAPLSESIRNGFNLYLQQHNNMLGNYKVEVKYEDDQADPQVALRKYRQLVDGDKVNVLLGPISSAVAYALRDQVDKDHMLLIDANAAANDLSWKQKSDYVYRVSFSNWQNGSNAAAYFEKNLGKKAITVASDYAAGKEEIAAFKAAYEKAGGTVVKEIYPKLGTTDFGAYLTDIANQKPDMVYCFLAGTDAINFVQQYKQFGLQGKIPLAGSLELGDPLVTQPAGDAANGIVASVPYTPQLNNPVNQAFVKAYENAYHSEPNVFSVEGYDSAQVLAAALQKAGDTKSDDLAKALQGITIDSPRGPITLDPTTHNPVQNFYVVKDVKQGNTIEAQPVETIANVAMPASPPAN